MKLFIHAGCHKTASTSFQQFCFRNLDHLLENDIYYPLYKNHSQHSRLLWDVQEIGIKIMQNFFNSVRENARNHKVVLLSGEDFENCIIDVGLAIEIENLAIKEGFDEIYWVFVYRDPIDYLNSIYAQLSKENIVMNYDIMKKSVIDRGYICVSTFRYNYYFVIDFHRHIKKFRKNIKGNLLIYSFEEFVKPSVGERFFSEMIQSKNIENFNYKLKNNELFGNKRMNDLNVEYNYLMSFMGIRKSQQVKIIRWFCVSVLWPCIVWRWFRTRRQKRAARREFGVRTDLNG